MVAVLSVISDKGIGWSSSICDRAPNWEGRRGWYSMVEAVEQEWSSQEKWDPKVSGRGRLE